MRLQGEVPSGSGYSSRGAILTDPPKLRITLRCLLEVLRNETTARRGGPGSFDGVEEGCSGLKSAAEASHGSRGASRCVSITRLGKDGRRLAAIRVASFLIDEIVRLPNDEPERGVSYNYI